MGDMADLARDDWDAAGRPSHEELLAGMDPDERDLALIEDWIEEKGHAEHDAWIRDYDYGIVCSCAEVLGNPPGLSPMAAPPVQSSATTAAAGRAVGMQVQTTTARVETETGLTSAVDPSDPILAELVLIDPTAVYDSKMVEEHLLEAVARLERGAHYERICAEDYAQRVLVYEKAYARALLAADSQGGAADIRKARAQIACEQEYVERMVAKMKLDAIQGTMHSLRSVCSSYQSVMKSIASTYSATGSNGRARY
jgi:hypothetical protein